MNTKMVILLAFVASSVVLISTAVSLPKGGFFISLLKFILMFIAVILNVLAFASRYYSNLMLAIFSQKSNDIILNSEDPYTISSSQDSIVTKKGTDYVATVFVKIPIYKSSTELSPEEKLEFARQVSRMVGLAKDPVRFSTQMHVMNKDVYISRLRDEVAKLESQEINLNQENKDSPELNKLKGKLSMWRNILDSINESQSLEVVNYATVSALGAKEFEAVSLAQQKATELISGISSVFGITPSIVTGFEILKFVEPDLMIPYSTISEHMIRNVEEEVI